MILPFLLGIMVMGFLGFRASNYEPKAATAEVERVQGILVFINARPVMEYEYLGTVESPSVVMSSTYPSLMPLMVKRTVEKYPDADGMIFAPGTISRADAIKFKK